MTANRNFGRIDPKRLHPHGYLIGGAHDKGLRLVGAGRLVGEEYFAREVSAGRIVTEKKGRKFMFRVKRRPRIDWGVRDELALLRSQHFLKNHSGEWWLSEAEFKVAFMGIFDSLVNTYKV